LVGDGPDDVETNGSAQSELDHQNDDDVNEIVAAE
jgi:ParB family chromosome partitioning protein